MLHGSTSLFYAVLAVVVAVCTLQAAAAPLLVVPRAAPSVNELFPYSRGLSSWTTFAGAEDALPLSDETLRPHDVGDSHTYVKYAGATALRAHYPAGSYRPGADDAPRGGISFYSPGAESVDLTTAKEATFGYSVMFPAGFDFVKGGKLPGFYGGDSDEESKSCSGGSRNPKCFSVRLMWRPAGAGEFYTYLPSYEIERFAANKKQCEIPNSDCNPTYGTSIARGSFHFKPGQWVTVTERVKLNTAGEADGELELFVNGVSVINVSGLILRDGDQGRFRGLFMQSFFGGHSEDWATPMDQDVYFANLSVAILETLDGQSSKKLMTRAAEEPELARRWIKTEQSGLFI